MYPPRGLHTHLAPQALFPREKTTVTQVGCVYEKGGQNFQEFGPVILASGHELSKRVGVLRRQNWTMKKTLVV